MKYKKKNNDVLDESKKNEKFVIKMGSTKI